MLHLSMMSCITHQHDRSWTFMTAWLSLQGPGYLWGVFVSHSSHVPWTNPPRLEMLHLYRRHSYCGCLPVTLLQPLSIMSSEGDLSLVIHRCYWCLPWLSSKSPATREQCKQWRSPCQPFSWLVSFLYYIKIFMSVINGFGRLPAVVLYNQYLCFVFLNLNLSNLYPFLSILFKILNVSSTLPWKSPQNLFKSYQITAQSTSSRFLTVISWFPSWSRITHKPCIS